MLKNIDLSREVAKAEYKRLKGDADLKLAALQRQVKALGIPVIVVFEGWSAAGKGTLINELILPLDPRGFTVHSASRPTEEQAFYPVPMAVLEADADPRAAGHFRPELESQGRDRPDRGAGQGETTPPGVRGHSLVRAAAGRRRGGNCQVLPPHLQE